MRVLFDLRDRVDRDEVDPGAAVLRILSRHDEPLGDVIERATALAERRDPAHLGALVPVWNFAPTKGGLPNTNEQSPGGSNSDQSVSSASPWTMCVYLFQRRHDEAIAEGERAVALSPNTAQNYSTLGFTLAFSGRHAEAITLLKKAMRLSPYYPDYMVWMLGMARTEAGQYEEAVQILKSSLERNPNHFLPYVRLAAALSEMGREAEARAAAAQILRINPNFTITYWERVSPYKDVAAWARHRNALLIAGLPE